MAERLAVLCAAVLTLACAGCASPTTGRVRDSHLLWKSTPKEREITAFEQGGPFWEKVQTADGATRESIRPLLWTRSQTADGYASSEDILYPIYSRYRRGTSVSSRFLLFFSLNKDVENSDSQNRLWLFPFWFSGQTRAGEDYAALFPIHGTIREMYWDKINFTLFPIWTTWDRAGNHTWSILWPIIQRQKGATRDALRIFPLWARSSKKDDFDAGYFLWPFWTHADYHARNPGYDWMLWPLVGRVNRQNENTWRILPPLFSFAYGQGKVPEYRKIDCPWPLVMIYDDEDIHKRIFFPFSIHRWREDGKSENRTLLWPFWHTRQVELDNRACREWSLWPVLRHTIMENIDKDSGERTLDEDYFRVWPLYSRRFDPEHRLVRVPDLRWNKREGVLEQVLLGMFTLYTRGESTEGENKRVDHELLWGLFHHGYGEGYSATHIWPLYSTKEERGAWRWSILGGLLGRSGNNSGKRAWRYLWVFGSSVAEADDSVEIQEDSK